MTSGNKQWAWSGSSRGKDTHDMGVDLSLWSTHPHLYLQGRLGSQDEELVLDASPVSESLGAALEQQRWRPRIEAWAKEVICSPSNRTCIFCHSSVTWFAGGSAIYFWIKKLLPEVLSLNRCRGKHREWHTYCANPFMNKLLKSNSTSTSLAFFNEPVSNKWPLNSTKQLYVVWENRLRLIQHTFPSKQEPNTQHSFFIFFSFFPHLQTLSVKLSKYINI